MITTTFYRFDIYPNIIVWVLHVVQWFCLVNELASFIYIHLSLFIISFYHDSFMRSMHIYLTICGNYLPHHHIRTSNTPGLNSQLCALIQALKWLIYAPYFFHIFFLSSLGILPPKPCKPRSP
jgi:hypothetical protein